MFIQYYCFACLLVLVMPFLYTLRNIQRHTKAFSEPFQTSEMELFAKIVNGFPESCYN